MRSIYAYAQNEYPFAFTDEGIMDAAENMLYSVNDLRQKEHYVKQILGKTSLTVEQRLTYIAALFTEPETTIHTYGGSYSDDEVFHALLNDRLEVIDTLT